MSPKNPFMKNPSLKFKPVDNLDKKEAESEIANLREAIEHHNYLYYVKNSPEISDEAFDKLFHRLQDLEKAFPDLQSPNSPTRRVGAKPVDALKKVEHTAPLLSLDSALEEGKIANFDDFVHRNAGQEKIEYVLEPKMDGLSVEIVYEKGTFRYGATRGDGQVGEDISENLKTIGSVPLHLRRDGELPSFIAVRGEILLSKKGFQELNKQRVEVGDEPFANPRNAAAGIVRQLDSKKVAGKPLVVFFYDILKIEGVSFSSHWQELEKFPEWGFRTNPLNSRCASMEEVKKFHQNLIDKRDELDYEIDGIVIKLDNLEARNKLGMRERNPRWAMAWKFPPKKEVTVLQDIVVSVGRTGMLTPVALLDPVNVGGVTVSRATLHNEDEVKKKDVRPGDKVRVIRAGDVIPEVVERIEEKGKKRGKEFSMPSRCPVCGTKVVREGAYYFCPNGLACRAQLVGHIIHYVSRNAMDIENLGEKIVRRFVERSMVKDLADLYHLSVDDILEVEGFAEKSATQLYNAIQNAKNPRFERFLYALGIRHVGEHIARVLAREFKTLDSLKRAELKDLQETNEIGPEIAESVYTFFHEKENMRILDRLLDAGLKIQGAEAAATGILEGKTFVFTGELENYTREEAKELVESLGGRATSSVSGNTDYVVVGANPGSKLNDAREHNVEILEEQAFE
ncbi:MAG: NAD-dependent DNA ligase LigA, partial [Calditrichia bacterium]